MSRLRICTGMGRHNTWHAWKLARSGASAPETEVVAQRSRPFGAAVGQAGGAMLLAKRDEHGVTGYVALPPRSSGRSAETAVSSLAAAVAARAEPVDELPDLSESSHFGWLAARPSVHVSRDTQAGGDPAEVAMALSRVMLPGSWVAITMRRAKRSEFSRTRRWFEHRLAGVATHYSRESESLLCSIFAGGQSAADVEGTLLQVAAVLPGFDIDVRVVGASDVLPVAGLTGLGVGGLLGAGIGVHQWAYGAIAAGVCGVSAGAVAAGIVPTAAVRLKRAVATSVLPLPARRHIPPRRPQAERNTTGPNGQSRHRSASDGAWPLAPSTFMLGPAMVVGLVAPHAGMSSDVAATRTRRTPAALTADIGPMVGFAGDDNDAVHIDAATAWEGVAALGVAGSGKTELLQNLFAWNVIERVSPSGRPGRPGKSNSLVVFENKGEGVAGWQRWIALLGDQSVLVEVAEQTSSAIDLFDVPGNAAERASFFVNAMVYAFESGSIQDRSYESLTAVFAAALCIDPGVAAGVGLGPDSSPVDLAYVLLGGAGDDTAVHLAAALASAATTAPEGPAKTDMVAALRRLAPMFETKVTLAQRRTLSESPRNKVALLAEARSWWSPSRPRVSWDRAVTEHWALIINTGVTSTGQLVDERLSSVMSSILAYGLRASIMRSCSTWRDQGRSVSIFADELALLAGSSAEVITWLRNQGRSYGVRCSFAAQYPEQLDLKVRDCLLGFSTIFWFRQNNPTVVAAAVAQLSMLGGEWAPADIAGLELYRAILLTVAGGQTQPAVPIKVAWWGEDPDRFPADQGYATPAGYTAPLSYTAPPPGAALPVPDPVLCDDDPAIPVSAPGPDDPYASSW